MALIMDPGAGQEQGLRFAMVMSPSGQVSMLDWAGLDDWVPAHGFLWLHMERDDSLVHAWLNTKSGLDPLLTEALVAEDSRPRVDDVDDALLVVLRGVNRSPDCPPDEASQLVPLHMWVDANRCITLRDKNHNLEALHNLRLVMLSGKGPRTPGALLARIAEKVVDHVGDFITELEETLSELEDAISQDARVPEARSRVNELRRNVVSLRRYLSPQRDALYRLRHDDASWLNHDAKMHLREVNDKLNRHLDDLDEMRQRSTLLHEELGAKVAEQTNRNIFVMSIASVILLPMTFITGFFGMNTGGLPFNTEMANGTELATLVIILVGILTSLGLVVFLRR